MGGREDIKRGRERENLRAIEREGEKGKGKTL